MPLDGAQCPAEHTPLWQSLLLTHSLPFTQRAQPPPQSTSVSVPSPTPLPQELAGAVSQVANVFVPLASVQTSALPSPPTKLSFPSPPSRTSLPSLPNS